MWPLTLILVFVVMTRAFDSKSNVVERTRTLKKSVSKLYQHEGCFNAGSKAGVHLGDFYTSNSPVENCAEIASDRGFTEFSLEKGGHCRGGHDLQESYMNHGTSLACRNGVGARDALDIYSIKQRPRGCNIESSDKVTKRCRRHRQQETAKTRLDYELGQPLPYYPLPSLNRSREEVYKILQRDALDDHWIRLYNSTIFKNLGLFVTFLSKTKNMEFESEGDYTRTYNFFVKHQLMFVHPDDQQYFRFQFQDDSNPFRNLSELGLWRDDGVFTDQRLAGGNPMAIKRVSWDAELHGGVDWTELSEKLNPKFDWEGAIQDVLGMDISLDQAIRQGYIYAVHYPLYDGLPPVSGDPFGTLMDAFSPIAIFASKPSRQQLPNRLKPVAIQLNNSQDSPVFTPEDSELWLKAKHVLQVADFAQAQVVEHLFKLHLYMEPICVCIHRHLSKLHPLHQLLKHHCRGLIGSNKFGYPFLMAPVNGSMDKLLTVGVAGAVTMMLRAFQEVSWDDMDFLANIRNRGLDDKDKLPYFPYRDDGGLIHKAISNMVNEYVDQYYKSHKEVRQDTELQTFARDTSVGSGKVKNFPTKITSKWILKKHLTRLIWVLSVQHSAINYPVDHIAALTPNTPTKLYNDDRVGVDHYRIYNLPRRFTCGSQTALSMTLASMHYDSLFDYAHLLPDKKGRMVVQKYYDYLHGYVKSTIQERNAQRFERGHLPYPYLVPGWIANSIHT